MKLNRKSLLPAVLLGAALFVTPPAAFAHAHPRLMTPAANSIGPSPAKVSITFSEALEPRFSSIEITDASGKRQLNTASSMPAPNDPKTLTLALPKLPPGAYEVHWVSVAADGHRLEGQYAFSVK